ncbi:peptidase C14 caspase catalytic subunit p20 [Streptomyces sp. P1-3]|uniref:peptidase C14 caspase catalytic subunit p20 n=1 Tax=Streptomyces sp. P1-3 TaxID=3421658 RepID=UPI003D35EC68
MSRERGRDAFRAAGLVGALAVDTYDNPAELHGREVLRHIGAESARFVRMARNQLGFGEVLDGPAELTRAQVSAWLDDFLDRAAERKILYWTGHGVDAGGGFHLACRDSWARGDFDPSCSFALTELVDRILEARNQAHTLLVVDACSSHGHLRQALSRAVSKDRASVAEATERATSGFAVIGTSGVGETIREGLWMTWLSNVLSKPDIEVADHSLPMHRSALYISVPYLVEAIDREAAAEGLETKDERPGFETVRPLPNNFLHNPYFDDEEDGGSRRRWARPAVLADDAPLPWAEESPFLLQEGGVLEREFTGRHAALSRLVRWLDTVAHGMQVVTGPGGSGKTALLGMLGLLSVARRRQRLDPQPPPQICPRPGTIHALVTCRDRSLSAVIDAVWDALGAFEAMPRKPPTTCDADSCAAAVGDLAQKVGALNLVFDGLDEAMPGQAHEIARQLLNRLADTPGVKVVVGTRPRPRRQLAEPAPAESLLDVLDRTTTPLALDEDDDTERDIASMAEAVLGSRGSRYAGERQALLRREAAEITAEASDGLFLVARLITGQLVRGRRLLTPSDLEAELRQAGAGLETWVRREITHLEGDGARPAAGILAPLALAHGGGLRDLTLVAAMANALLKQHGQLTRDHAGDLLALAEGSLVTVDCGTYRLAHAGYGAHILQRLGMTPQEGHREVHDALRAHCGGDWARADDYTRSYLAVHAAQAGTEQLRELLDDPEYLAHTDPDVMLPLAVTQVRECEGAALYVRVADGFRSRPDPVTRRALLRSAAFVSHRDGAYRKLTTPGFAALPWTELWTDAGPAPLDLRWPAARGGARALHWSGTSADTALSVGVLGAVAVHDPETGKQRLTRRAPDRRRSLRQVTSAAAGARRVTVAGNGQRVLLWDDASTLPAKVFDWGGAPKALTAAECGSRFLAMAADGQRVWAWRWSTDKSASEAGLAGILGIPADRLALLSLGARYFLVSAGAETHVHEVYPAARGERMLGPHQLLAHAGQRPVRAIAALAEPARPEDGPRARCAWLARADGHTADVWRLTPGSGLGPDGIGQGRDWTVDRVLSVDSRDARGVALGYWGARPLLVLHQGSVVSVHDIRGERRLCAFPVHGHRDPEALACDPRGTGRIAVSDGPQVRILDVAAATAAARPHGLDRSYTDRLMVEPAAAPEGGPALLCRVTGDVVVAGYPGTAGAGSPGPMSTEPAPLHHDSPVTAVRAVWHEGRWLIASAFDRTVRVWSLPPDLRDAAPPQDIRLQGDTGEIARGLGLVVEHDGVPSLFVPDSRHVRRWRLHHGRWRVQDEVDALAHTLSVRVMADGRTLAVIDTGRGFRLWDTAKGEWDLLPVLEDAGRRTAMMTLGEHHVMRASIPLLAWGEEDLIHLARYKGGRWATHRVPYDAGAPSALVFTGSPQRPLLVVCGGERTLSVFDATTRRALRGAAVPWRGLDVEAAGALYQEGRGVTLTLQGRRRCDQILISADVLSPSRTPGRTGRPRAGW